MLLHKITKKEKVRSLVDEEAVADHRETEPFCFFFFFTPFLILIKGPLQDKQCLPTLQFTQRGPLRPERWFLNVHWQVGLICVLSRWRWTYIYIYLSYLAYIPLSRYFSTSVKLYGTSLHEKHTGPPQVLLSSLYMPCCVKGEDRSSRQDLNWDSQRLLHTKADWEPCDSSTPPSTLTLSAAHVQWGWHNIVSATLNPVIVWSVVNSWDIWAKVDRVQVAELLSQHYNYIAPMIQLHYKVTLRPQSHDAVTLGKCQ